MDKLLIVDDEYLTRTGLSETVDWAKLGFTVVGTAKNGEEGLALARTLKPDLIISDIRMPVMDGLDMAKALHSENADVAVIVYSGYKDFEYAHRALEYGVACFLLKPIENEELEQKVCETMQRLREKRNDRRVLSRLEKNVPLLRQQMLFSYFRSPDAEIRNFSKEQLSLVQVEFPQNGIFIYCKAEKDLPLFLEAAERRLEGFENISEAFDQFGVLITDSTDERFVKTTLEQALTELVKRTETRFTVSVVRFHGDAFAAFREAETLSENALYSAINAIATKEDGGRPFKKLIRDALAIIERDYAQKLSIKAVAQRLYTSESHLMHEFKDEVGKTFNECLTDFRILKAKELLLSEKLRVNEVAYAVGYTDVKYFGQVFREQTGMTPSEYAFGKKQ